jgi:hypothetical protein
VSRLDVIVWAAGQLAKSSALNADLIEMERIRPALSIRKDYLATIIMHLRVAHRSAAVIHEVRELTRADVQFAQPAESPVGFALHVTCVVAEVRVPVPVLSFLPTCEDYFLVPPKQIQQDLPGTVASGAGLVAVDKVTG